MTEVSDDRIRELAREILARPEFAAAHPSMLQEWLLRVIERILDWLASFGDLRITAPGLFWPMFAALVLILIFMLAQIVWAISAAMRAAEPQPGVGSSEPVRDPAAEAEQKAATGNFLEAAHCLMIASFRTLAEKSVIELRPDRANRWIRRALSSSRLNEALVRELDGLVARTERQWFGDRENNPDIYTEWKSAFEQVLRVA